MTRRKPAGTRLSNKPSKGATAKQAAMGELRIIGGDWRSRKVRFPDVGGVRPTPARTRETLFNWLSFHLAGSDCLDLFAGSGALGLEALSRGAAHATFIDNNAALATALRDNLRLLGSGSGSATVVCTGSDAYLSQRTRQPYDIIFMDPPFRQGWLTTLFPLLDTQGWLKPGGWVYVEYESDIEAPAAPANWQLHRQKTAGQVTYCLYRVSHAAGRSE